MSDLNMKGIRLGTKGWTLSASADSGAEAGPEVMLDLPSQRTTISFLEAKRLRDWLGKWLTAAAEDPRLTRGLDAVRNDRSQR